MDLNSMRALSYDELLSLYRKFLHNQSISKATINTAYVATFYLWRKESKELFWDVLATTDFEKEARNALLKALSENSSGNVNSLVSGYMSHLRRFRLFLSSNEAIKPIEYKQQMTAKPKSASREIIINKMYVRAYLSEGDNIGHEIITFPSKEKELNILCKSLGVVNTAKTEVEIGTVHNDERLSTLLSHQIVNLDELNFLMKRLDSFNQNELAIFFAAAYAEKAETMTELINLCFNTHCYSLVADFSDLNAVCKQMYLTEQIGVSTKDFESLDGQKYFEKMIAENPNPMLTPYGVVYRNSNEIVQT